MCKSNSEVLAGTCPSSRRNKPSTQTVYSCLINNKKALTKALSKSEKATILTNPAAKFATIAIEPVEKAPPPANVCRYKVGFVEMEEKPLQIIVGILDEECDGCRGVRTGEMREEVDEVKDLGWEKRGNLS
jgi:hypothetical protein